MYAFLKLTQYRNEIIAVLVLFFTGLGLRLLYQENSIVDNPSRADAGKYYCAAYNLYHFGIHSLELPREDRKPPESRTDLSPGYPLFLFLFMDEESHTNSADFLARVMRVQALMGAFVVVFTFVLGRLCLKFPWAILAGTLTALNPHLIAMDGYALTESLFTFVLMLGALLLAVSWRANRSMFTLIAGLLLALSAQIRAVSYLLLLALAPIFLLDSWKMSFARKKDMLRHLALAGLGFLLVTGAHREFVKLTVTHEPSILALGAEKSKVHEVRPAPSHYVTFSSPWTYVKTAVRPPNFFVEGKSHVLRNHHDGNWKKPTEAGFWEEPLAYLKWSLGGKISVMWHWDNAYNGDVDIYPMIRSGFKENLLLKLIHQFMHSLHWPLFWLSIAAPIILFVQWRRKSLVKESMVILVPILGFLCFLSVLWVLFWLPRYTIPVRPFSYLLVAFSLSWAGAALLKDFKVVSVRDS